MARMRSIKPEFWSDQDITKVSRDVRLLYVALWNFTDEQARMPGDPRLVKSWCFPLDDDVTAGVVDEWLGVLEAAGKVIRYSIAGALYLHLPRLGAHQKLDPRLESRHPSPPAEIDRSEINTDQSVRTPVENETQHLSDVAKHVAGGMEHVAGGRGHDAREATPPNPDEPEPDPSPSRRGTRLPDDWQPSTADIGWARDQGYADVWARQQTDQFRDYWHSESGSKATKLDWSKAWKVWLRRDGDKGFAGSRASPSGTTTAKANAWMTVGRENAPLKAIGGGM